MFPKEVWEAADINHGFQWWQSFGDDFEFLNILAMKVLSKPVSASACEFLWSDVSQVITKKVQRLKDETIEKVINVRAMKKLERQSAWRVLQGNIPKIDDFLDSLVQEAIDGTEGGGDDVADADELEDDASGSEDEDLDVVSDEEEEDLYELTEQNNDLVEHAARLI